MRGECEGVGGESVRVCEGEVYMRVHNNAENHTDILECEGVRV